MQFIQIIILVLSLKKHVHLCVIYFVNLCFVNINEKKKKNKTKQKQKQKLYTVNSFSKKEKRNSLWTNDHKQGPHCISFNSHANLS